MKIIKRYLPTLSALSSCHMKAVILYGEVAFHIYRCHLTLFECSIRAGEISLWLSSMTADSSCSLDQGHLIRGHWWIFCGLYPTRRWPQTYLPLNTSPTRFTSELTKERARSLQLDAERSSDTWIKKNSLILGTFSLCRGTSADKEAFVTFSAKLFRVGCLWGKGWDYEGLAAASSLCLALSLIQHS